MPPHSLNNLEIQRHYKNQSIFDGAYSRNNLPKNVKDEAYVINLDEHANTGTHWVTHYVQDNDATYFDSFGIEHISKKIKYLQVTKILN